MLPSRLPQRVRALAALGSAALAPAPDRPVVDPDDLTRLAAAVDGKERVRID